MAHLERENMEAIKVRIIFQEDGKLLIENLPGHKGEEAEVIILLEKPMMVPHQLLEPPMSPRNGFGEPDSTRERIPPCTEWPAGFFEEVIGGWHGEPLERPEQGEYEQRIEIV